MASDEIRPVPCQSSLPTYMSCLPESFQMMADVLLIVKDVGLPAHKAILAANSTVFAELFSSPESAGSSTKENGPQALPQVPLVGENIHDVKITLTYLYKSCVFSTDATPVNSPEDAKALIKVAHKFGMQSMLDASEAYLIPQVRAVDEDSKFILMTNNEALVSWTALAEECGLSKLLAHCEDFMIRDDDESLWHDKALLDDRVSRNSLLRILRALQKSKAQAGRLGRIGCRVSSDIQPEISALMLWQKEH